MCCRGRWLTAATNGDSRGLLCPGPVEATETVQSASYPKNCAVHLDDVFSDGERTTAG